jgi:septal ring factor EnvC (AmiA/AmiB activator)
MMRCGLSLAVLMFWLAAQPADSATLKEYQGRLQTHQQNIRQEKQDLDKVHRQLRQKKKHIRKQKKQERSFIGQLQRIDKKLGEAEEHYEEHQKNLGLVRQQVAQIRAAMAETETTLQKMKALLAIRLRLLYRERSGGFWRVLAASRTFSEGLSRLKFFHILASQNAFLIENLRRRQDELERQNKVLAQRAKQVKEFETASRRTLKQIKRQRTARSRKLKKVRRERALHEQTVRELSTASRKLNSLIQTLEKRARILERRIEGVGSAFARRRRSLPWPTRGRVVSRFGKRRHPRFNTYIHNKGIDIAGPIGQNVFSVAPGQVLFAEWFEGYGRMIILDHGGGYNTIYAHLKKIKISEGDMVKNRQAVGTLGDSGTWKGPALYFEIRKRGKALNPIQWLKT